MHTKAAVDCSCICLWCRLLDRLLFLGLCMAGYGWLQSHKIWNTAVLERCCNTVMHATSALMTRYSSETKVTWVICQSVIQLVGMLCSCIRVPVKSTQSCKHSVNTAFLALHSFQSVFRSSSLATQRQGAPPSNSSSSLLQGYTPMGIIGLSLGLVTLLGCHLNGSLGQGPLALP